MNQVCKGGQHNRKKKISEILYNYSLVRMSVLFTWSIKLHKTITVLLYNSNIMKSKNEP